MVGEAKVPDANRVTFPTSTLVGNIFISISVFLDIKKTECGIKRLCFCRGAESLGLQTVIYLITTRTPDRGWARDLLVPGFSFLREFFSVDYTQRSKTKDTKTEKGRGA